ncbi:MAG: hypothetical protein J6P31_02265 [Oscillospiraceae bacterium]|nr:hypothetical protein [Oscillospiraceae bacterium]
MTLQAILESNRDHLLSALSDVDATSAARVLTGELDRILYTFVDQEERSGVREAAGSMIQTAKAAVSLVDSAGETKIFGRIEYGKAAPEKKKPSLPGLVLLIAGLVCAVVTIIGVQLLATSAAAGSADWESAGLPPRSVLLLIPLLGAAALFFSGMLLRRKAAGSRESLHTETKVDPVKVYNHLLSMILVMDKCLEDTRVSDAQAEKTRSREAASAMDPAELDLLAQLLEDAYGRRGSDEQADEEISQIRFYLHRKHIDVVDYAGDAATSGWFDLMPAFQSGTIRPALAADGKLLRKGMASAGGR